MKTVMDNLQYRIKTQPQGYASIGCIFKNVELEKIESRKLKIEVPKEFLERKSISAGWLVEQVGMKGAAVGQAQVSEKHGNFIVNKKGATAEDVLALIAQIKERVYDTYGITLEEEIQII
jgi:UDP-N-acetylmuramate dehydrogenase